MLFTRYLQRVYGVVYSDVYSVVYSVVYNVVYSVSLCGSHLHVLPLTA